MRPLGKRPKKEDRLRRTLQLRRFLVPAKLPPLPESDLDFRQVPSWPMLSNSRYGDCVLAAAAHVIQSLTTQAGSRYCPSEQDVVDLYFEMTGGQDIGLYLLDVLNRWRQQGLWGHRIEAFAELTPGDVVQSKYAQHIFGSTFIGLALPDDYEPPWITPRGPPNYGNGHCIPPVGYDPAVSYPVTWGTVEPMSQAWQKAYCDEAYVVFTKDWLNAQGLSPDGFDLAGLQQALAEITGETPEPPPEPEPPEPVPPGCLARIFPFLSLIRRK